MKRAPSPCPAWLKTCRIEHDSGNAIDFPMIQDEAALLWVVNLGCIDLNHGALRPGSSPWTSSSRASRDTAIWPEKGVGRVFRGFAEEKPPDPF
jgi:hypothetical protein